MIAALDPIAALDAVAADGSGRVDTDALLAVIEPLHEEVRAGRPLGTEIVVALFRMFERLPDLRESIDTDFMTLLSHVDSDEYHDMLVRSFERVPTLVVVERLAASACDPRRPRPAQPLHSRNFRQHAVSYARPSRTSPTRDLMILIDRDVAQRRAMSTRAAVTRDVWSLVVGECNRVQTRSRNASAPKTREPCDGVASQTR